MDIHPKKDIPYVINQFERQAKGEFSLSRDLPVKRKDGSVFYADVNATTIKISGKTYLMGFFHDTTERKKTEEKIKLFSDAIASAFDCIFLADLKGNITYANESASLTFGYTLEELLKLNITKLDVDSEDAEKVMKEIAAKGKWSGEVINLKKNKEKFPSLLSAFIINDEKGNPKGTMGILRDITKLKKAEGDSRKKGEELTGKVKELAENRLAILNMMEDMAETNKQLMKTQKELKEADAKKDQFVSIVAHELKTPLTSIHGFSQLLQDRKIANNFTQRNNYLKIMDHETGRLGKLVGDILDLSRIDMGTIKTNVSRVNLKSVIDDISKEMDMQMKEKGLKSEYRIDKKLPAIGTDPEKLTQILLNLITNAVKYTPKGKIIFSAFPENGHVHFCVKDTGIGISRENQTKLFRRFYQVDSSYTRKAGGSGLGLALSKEFVQLLGGRIWVKSREGEGSEFHFTLPVRGPRGSM
jgi:PAS domain S-box-containing protein